jgi:trans-AT polyketide synthase, acyltransferase and oxidoreductase domains
VHRVRETVSVVRLADGGMSAAVGNPQSLPVVGVLPPLYPEWLGDRSFPEAHGLRFPYASGEMANGRDHRHGPSARPSPKHQFIGYA